MAEVLASRSLLRLIRQVGECFELSDRPTQRLDNVATVIGKHLQIDRCSILLAGGDNSTDPYKEFSVDGDYCTSGSSVKGRTYKVAERSELLNLLQSGKSIPINDIRVNDTGANPTKGAAQDSSGSTPRDLPAIAEDTGSQSVVVLPMRAKGSLVGCLTMHYLAAAKHFSDDILELSEILADLIALKCDDAQDLAVLQKPETKAASKDSAKTADETVGNLSKQLSWERWVRQIICKLHATLDRDLLLQSVVDGFGRSLGASRCLIVRTDGLASPIVTHEYVEPDISPLGLGRTGPFPLAAIMPFRHKAGAITDISVLQKGGDLTDDEYEYFSENAVSCIAGAPIASHGAYYGVIVILERESSKKWAPHELDMLEFVAAQMAVALGHCQSYQQLKDQLFNMNLLGNLTQQLTSTLELVSRSGGKIEQPEEKIKTSFNSPPLSLREMEVLKLIASGLANREIAQRLFLTESTVELHASRIRKKLKLKSRTALVKYACDNGLA